MLKSTHAALWAVLVTTTGCGLYAGPNGMVPMSGEKAVVGATAGLHVHPFGSEGLLLRVGGEGSIPEGTGRSARGWVQASAGYAVVPLPYMPRVGVEVSAGFAGGVLPDAMGYPFSMGGIWRVATPIRISPTRRPWELGEQTEVYSLLTPTFEVVQLVPLTTHHPHDLTTTFVFGLEYWTDFWAAVEP